MRRSDIFWAIGIIVSLMLLRLVFMIDESHILVYIVGGFIILYRLVRYFERRWFQDTLSEPESEQKHAALFPLHHNGQKYTYIEDMPPAARQSYDRMIAAIHESYPDNFERALLKMGQRGLVLRLKEAEKMKATGLIGEAEFAAIKRRLLAFQETVGGREDFTLRVQDIEEMKASGLIDEEEFITAKKQLLTDRE